MFEGRVRLIIQEKYIDLVGSVIEKLKDLPMQNIQDFDIKHDNVWDGFVELVQQEDNEDNVLYPIYADVITEVCQQALAPLTLTELELLWLISDGCLEWDETEEFPEVERMVDDVTEELLSWIEQEAEEPEFEDSIGEEDVYEENILPYEEDYEDDFYVENDDDIHKTRH
jgi:hypothetical protein